MSFGGLAPFPIRLGPGGDESISPEQWLRLCDDVAGQMQPLVSLLITEPPAGIANDGPCTVTGRSMGGTSLTGITCTRTTSLAGVAMLELSIGEYYTDPVTGQQRRWKPLAGHAQMVGCFVPGSVDAPPDIQSNTSITVSYWWDVATTGVHTLILWGLAERGEPGDYGAEPTKAQAAYEGEVPYAYTWLLECRGMRGSVFESRAGSFVEMENIAMARVFGLLQRHNERHVWNQLPADSDQCIGRWAKLMDVGTTGDKDWQARRKCAARFALITGGPSDAAISDAMAAIFGPAFVTVHRFPGTLDAAPAPTYWPGVSNGPGALDIDGNGAWTSQRYHFIVQLTAANDAQRDRVLALAHRDADELFFSSLVPVCTWGYSFNVPGNFILGTDQLGRDSL